MAEKKRKKVRPLEGEIHFDVKEIPTYKMLVRMDDETLGTVNNAMRRMLNLISWFADSADEEMISDVKTATKSSDAASGVFLQHLVVLSRHGDLIQEYAEGLQNQIRRLEGTIDEMRSAANEAEEAREMLQLQLEEAQEHIAVLESTTDEEDGDDSSDEDDEEGEEDDDGPDAEVDMTERPSRGTPSVVHRKR